DLDRGDRLADELHNRLRGVDRTGRHVLGHLEGELRLGAADVEIGALQSRAARVRRMRHQHAEEWTIDRERLLRQVAGAGNLVADRSAAELVEKFAHKLLLNVVTLRDGSRDNIAWQRRDRLLCLTQFVKTIAGRGHAIHLVAPKSGTPLPG